VLIGADAIRASFAGRRAVVARLLGGVALPVDWPEPHLRAVMQRRLAQMTLDPESAPWLLRVMVRREDCRAVGYINFHGPPNEAGQAELGYTVFPSERRKGYATEAVEAMMAWARDTHGARHFLVSISPGNAASLALARKLRFERIGSHIDDIDGPEDEFELALE
jgi:RimJ/RimL family protein N-acetyltransferase